MSAPATARRSAVDRRYCKTPHFVHRGLFRECTYTQALCFGLVLDATVGWRREWADVSLEQFASACGVSARFIEIELGGLLSADMGWLEAREGKARKSESGRIVHGTEYRVRIRVAGDGEDEPLQAKCGACGVMGAMDRDRGHCRTPHSYWRKLGRCLTHAAWLVLGVILDETAGWNEERGVLDLADIMRDTGLSRRSVQMALGELMQLGLIGRDLQTSAFWVCPERFDHVQRRPARTITPTPYAARRSSGPPEPEGDLAPDPEPDDEEHLESGFARMESGPRNRDQRGSAVDAGEESPNEEDASSEEVIDDAEVILISRAAEYVSHPICRCRSCGAIGPVHLVCNDVGAQTTQFPPRPDDEAGALSRAGPSADSPPSPKQSAAPEVGAELRPLQEYLRAVWEPKIRRPASESVTREIWGALAGAPVGYLHHVCGPRAEYICRAGYPYKVMVTIARDAGGMWQAGAEEREQAERAARQRDEEAALVPLFETIDDARWWLARDDCGDKLRAQILAAFPELKG